MQEQNSAEWTTIIKPKSGWFDVNLRELWQYRDLIMLFVRRDFVQFYKQTILGPLWFFLQPFFTTVIFTVVFGNIAKIPTDGVPPMLFYMAGTITWTYFSTCLTKTSDTFIANANIFGKVYFPRLAVPISIVITNMITFGIQFLFFIGFLFYYWFIGTEVLINWYVLLLPVLLLMMAALGLGTGIIISSLTTKYRDLRLVVQFGVQLLMYATPVVYPLSVLPDKYLPLLLANPMTAIVEAFRYSFLGAGVFRWDYLGTSAAVILLTLALGVLLFSRVEKTFMDTV
ncbi:MAG: ABC transporter permease [Bacteroidia bacterium]|nr:ABC transporter permease [Bacteroidia bacterium]